MKEGLSWGNPFKCKLFPPHEPPSHARSSPTMRIQIRSICLKLKFSFVDEAWFRLLNVGLAKKKMFDLLLSFCS